uniref:Putative secreted peptide n=1 Tax=Anopheles braziliensis TaxID=58242 RepID=A0A2M3ZN65_9DIPT
MRVRVCVCVCVVGVFVSEFYHTTYADPPSLGGLLLGSSKPAPVPLSSCKFPSSSLPPDTTGDRADHRESRVPPVPGTLA